MEALFIIHDFINLYTRQSTYIHSSFVVGHSSFLSFVFKPCDNPLSNALSPALFALV
jgi:purine nucleoside phosphorylase